MASRTLEARASRIIGGVRSNVPQLLRSMGARMSHNLLLVSLIVAGLVVIPRVSEAASVVLGIEPSIAEISLSVVLAALVSLVHERLRSSDARVLRQVRATHAALRRYVPAVLAAQIESGRAMECGEREVSVLFADIRGFISFAESRQATEIFRAVNQYTERVSEIVQRHGGTVIEFSGDGIMALFGVPHRLLDKERAAVAAGRAIIKATSRGGDAATGLALSVGVGIATGKDCVGDIRAADRVIWSAIGNTTNLAARLQGLTRSLDAAMVIDDVTWTAAHPTATDLELRRNVAVRGLRQPLTVHVLPLPRRD